MGQDQRVHPRTSRHGDHGLVFILYAVVAGLVIGLLTGGSVTRLGELRFRWAPLIVLGMTAQVLLFSSPLGDALGAAAPVAYVASDVAVLVAVWRNLAIPGLRLVLLGGSANLVAVVANGGYMPASADAVAALGRLRPEGYSNSTVAHGAVVGPLTDLFAMPGWVPLANVFSVGDVLIGIGCAIAVVATMHRRGPVEPAADRGAAAPNVPAPPRSPSRGAPLH